MQILQVSKSYSPAIGGVEKHLAALNQELLAAGHQVQLITQSQKKLPQAEKLAGVEIERILSSNLEKNASLSYKLKIWTEIIRRYSLFKKAELIHVHDVFWWLLPIYPLIRKKLFISFHGYEGNDLPSKKAIFWHRLAAKACRGSIAVGQFQEKYYGVTVDSIIYGASQIQQSQEKKLKQRLIYLGRLETDNGILSYLAALKILKDQGKNYHLDVYGDGSLRKTALAYAQKEQLAVKFHGFVANAQDFLLKYPTAFASSYLSIIEALASNCQVISYYHNQLKKDYLLITPFKNWLQISNQPQEIARLISQEARSNQAAATWAKKQNWAKIAQVYLDLWQKKRS